MKKLLFILSFLLLSISILLFVPKNTKAQGTCRCWNGGGPLVTCDIVHPDLDNCDFAGGYVAICEPGALCRDNPPCTCEATSTLSCGNENQLCGPSNCCTGTLECIDVGARGFFRCLRPCSTASDCVGTEVCTNGGCTANPVIPPPVITACGDQGGECRRILHSICPDAFNPTPIGGPGELGCGAGDACCIPASVGPPGGGGSGGGGNALCTDNASIDTAIGCIPVESTQNFARFFLRWGIGIAGGLAFLLIVFAGFQITTSGGDPKKLQAGRELLTSAIAGLLLLIFAAFILRIIGVNILQIPGF